MSDETIENEKNIGDILKALETELESAEAEFNTLIRQIPNYAHPKAPIGKEDKDSTAIKFVGKPPVFNFKPLDHVQLGEKLDIIDFDTATKVSGPKFYYLKNEGVLLQMALERYALDIVMKHGFTPFITPDVAKEEILEENGVRVCMTRDDDKDINLQDRCKYANNKKAALFVSLHRNQADSDAEGLEI